MKWLKREKREAVYGHGPGHERGHKGKREIKLRSEEILPTLIEFLGIVLVAILLFTYIKTSIFLGPMLVFIGLLAWVPLKFAGRSVRSVLPDIVFGLIDGGIISIIISVSVLFAGAVGAIFGAIIGDAMADGFAGMLEGRIAVYLRSKNIDESRTPMSSSMGKFSGVVLGAGIIMCMVAALGFSQVFATAFG